MFLLMDFPHQSLILILQSSSQNIPPLNHSTSSPPILSPAASTNDHFDHNSPFVSPDHSDNNSVPLIATRHSTRSTKLLDKF